MISRAFAICACASLLFILPISGNAHTRFFMSEPAPDAVLDTAPKQISLWFSNPVETAFSSIEVRGPDGKRVDMDEVRQDPDDPKVLEVELQTLQPGQYDVDWSVVSLDGHRVEGSFSFSVE